MHVRLEVCSGIYTMKSLQLIAKSTFSVAVKALGLVLILSGFAGSAHAGFPAIAVPEIDPASAASAIALVLGGTAMLMHRRK